MAGPPGCGEERQSGALMPELPEVETVRRGLEPTMAGRRIARADIRRPDLRRPFPADMAERLNGRRVLGLRRRSKYILADLDSGESLLIHLGMSGRMFISGADGPEHAPPGKHDHVILHMEPDIRVTFNDARRFGLMDLLRTDAEAEHPLLSRLGPEPLGNAFDGPALVQALRGRKTPVKVALLDQSVVAGLGNIYVCEVLHRTGLSPLRGCDRIAEPRVAALVPAIREVLREAIEAGGSSLRDHRRTNGELGYFQHRFQAYGREGQPCLTGGCGGTIRRVTQSGRSSFYCPLCQR